MCQNWAISAITIISIFLLVTTPPPPIFVKGFFASQVDQFLLFTY